MEEGDGDFGGGDFGNGGDGRNDDQFHRNEAISAVADEGFMVEEDDDYEDLYNDVNVGEGVFQSLHREDDRELGFKREEEEKKVGAAGGGGESNMDEAGGGQEKDLGGSRLEGYQDLGFRGNDSLLKTSAGAQEPERRTLPEGVSRTQAPPAAGGGGGVVKVEVGDQSMGEAEGQNRNNSTPPQGMMQQQQQQQQSHGGGVGQGGGNEGFARHGGGVNGGVGSGGGSYGVGNNGGSGGGSGGTMLFVGDLHWWTTDAELEAELCKYGNVREVRFFDEKASGKSKGYCQVEFYDPSAANACKEGMNGHLFNGRPCVVQHASPFTIRRMGEAQVNKNQAIAQSNSNLPPGRRGLGDGVGGGGGRGGNMPTGGNFQGGEGNRGGYGRGNWGRGNGQGMGGRGVGPMRNRMGGMGGGRGIMGNGGGNGFGQGLGPNPQMMHPQAMMGQGFDPGYGPNMGRMAGYGGFPAAPTPPFSGMMSSFPPVGGVGLPGVAPHVNPAFFGRGMPANGMGMMPNPGMEGHGMGMWPDPSAGGWVGEDPGGRAAESSYGEDAASEHQYGDASHERGGRVNAMKEKDRTSEREWSGPSNRKYREDRDPGSDRDMPREKDGQDYDYEWSERRPPDDRELSRDRDRPRDRERYRERDTERERSRDREPDRDRHREERDRDRDRHREDRDRHLDHHKYKDRGPEYDDTDHHRYKDRGSEYDDEWERGRSSRAYSKARISHEEDHHRARSRDAEYSKRRRLPSE